MVSRRTPVTCWIRSSGHPSRPSAQICCCSLSSKTWLVQAKDYTSHALVNVSAAVSSLPVLRCRSIADLELSTEEPRRLRVASLRRRMC